MGCGSRLSSGRNHEPFLSDKITGFGGLLAASQWFCRRLNGCAFIIHFNIMLLLHLSFIIFTVCCHIQDCCRHMHQTATSTRGVGAVLAIHIAATRTLQGFMTCLACTARPPHPQALSPLPLRQRALPLFQLQPLTQQLHRQPLWL